MAKTTQRASNTGSRERTGREDLSLSLSFSLPKFSSLGVLLGEVPLHVQSEMIAPGEGALADRAFKGLSPGVLAVMPRQFVAPGESPLTFRPLTLIRFLARVYPLMSLQVRALRIDFRTTYEIAVVHPALLQLWVIPPVELGRHRLRLDPMGRIENWTWLGIRGWRCPPGWTGTDRRAGIGDRWRQRRNIHQPRHRTIERRCRVAARLMMTGC